MFAASGCILLALSGCGVNNALSNTTGAQSTNQVKTTVSKKTPVHQTKYQPVPIPKLPITPYRTNIPVVLLPELVITNTSIDPHPPKTVMVNLPPYLKKEFVAYFAYQADPTHPLYIVLPKDMKPFGQNLVGEDGTFGFTFKDSSGNIFEIGSSALCNGCAASAGAGFFQAAEKVSLQDGSNPQPSLKEQGANVAYPKSDLALYAYSDKGMKTIGFNQYKTDMSQVVWGIDFGASYQGPNPDMNQVPWILQNLIEQNQVGTSTK